MMGRMQVLTSKPLYDHWLNLASMGGCKHQEPIRGERMHKISATKSSSEIVRGGFLL